MRRLSAFLHNWPFLSIGLITLGLFLALEASGGRLQPIVPVLRVLVLPLWLMRTLEMLVGIGHWSGPLFYLVAVPLLFLPYLGADLLLRAARRRRAAHQHAAV